MAEIEKTIIVSNAQYEIDCAFGEIYERWDGLTTIEKITLEFMYFCKVHTIVVDVYAKYGVRVEDLVKIHHLDIKKD